MKIISVDCSKMPAKTLVSFTGKELAKLSVMAEIILNNDNLDYVRKHYKHLLVKLATII